MAYKALRNFKIGREITTVGSIYSGGDIGILLAQGLIEEIKDEPKVSESLPESREELPTIAESAPEEAPQPKKAKKKKAG